MKGRKLQGKVLVQAGQVVVTCSVSEEIRKSEDRQVLYELLRNLLRLSRLLKLLFAVLGCALSLLLSRDVAASCMTCPPLDSVSTNHYWIPEVSLIIPSRSSWHWSLSRSDAIDFPVPHKSPISLLPDATGQ